MYRGTAINDFKAINKTKIRKPFHSSGTCGPVQIYSYKQCFCKFSG